MSDRGRSTLRKLAFAGAAALVLVVVWINSKRPAQPFPLPPYSESPFLNTGSAARYIGVEACADCHGRQHKSYLLTAHSRALGDPDLADEPPEGSFYHQASGRWYRVYRQGKTLRHEEALKNADGKEVARLDVPIRYRIGSGNFTRSYLVDIDGFLHESPITWYAGTKKWGMSPGYDGPRHQSFERPVDAVCLACHAGRVEAAEGTLHRMILHEKVIGCENCHGPGSLHQDRHRSGKFTPGAEDWTIVNPGKLSRPLLEAICSNCHLSGAATTMVRGRHTGDFRPGRPLTDYRLHYHLDVGSEQMSVVGHMEQLRRSVCYQKSPELTCLTCHDPHQREKPKEQIAFFRQKCLQCHAVRGCGLDQKQRLQKNPGDNCVACHMPRGDTDIPHISFTHHRIGIHPAPKSPPPDQIPQLVPDGAIAHLPPLDRKRNLGMAYVLAAQNPDCAAHAAVFRQRGKELLDEVWAAGLRQDESAAALVELYRDPQLVKEVGRHLRHAQDVPVHVRNHVQFLAALAAMEEGAYPSAIDLLKELTVQRRFADDWRVLGMAHLELDQPAQALPALQKALVIRPFRPSIHFGLAEAHRRLGETQLQQVHQEKGQWLLKHHQD